MTRTTRRGPPGDQEETAGDSKSDAGFRDLGFRGLGFRDLGSRDLGFRGLGFRV